jgi:hypothetical protein
VNITVGVIMRGNSCLFSGWRRTILAGVAIAAGLLSPAYCQTYDPVLLLQQTPLEGGTVTPAVGVHHFDVGADVTLTAFPKPGYQFVYWLGDVSDPTASATIVHLDAPKIVIAVFERAEYELLALEQRTPGAPVGGLVASIAASRQGGFGGPGGRRPHKFRWPTPPEPEEPADFPVPTPEPTTVALLAVGGLFVFSRRRAKR